MSLNKAQQKRINNAVRRGNIATMQRRKEKLNTTENGTQAAIRPTFVRG